MVRNAIRAFLTRTEEPNGGFLIHDEFEEDRWNHYYGYLSDWADWGGARPGLLKTNGGPNGGPGTAQGPFT